MIQKHIPTFVIRPNYIITLYKCYSYPLLLDSSICSTMWHRSLAIGTHNFSTHGSDGLIICNQYKTDVSVAIAWKTSHCANEGLFTKAGWIQLKPKICCYSLSGNLVGNIEIVWASYLIRLCK
jgi:hypothetical protein